MSCLTDALRIWVPKASKKKVLDLFVSPKEFAGDPIFRSKEDVLPFNKIEPAYRPEEIVLPKEMADQLKAVKDKYKKPE